MSRRNGLVLALSATLFAGTSLCYAADPGYDFIIRNGHIVDGTGSP